MRSGTEEIVPSMHGNPYSYLCLLNAKMNGNLIFNLHFSNVTNLLWVYNDLYLTLIIENQDSVGAFRRNLMVLDQLNEGDQ